MLKILAWIVFALIVAFVAKNALLPNATPAMRTVDRTDACSISQTFVKRQLKAPSSAKFPLWTEENCKVTQRERVWVVRSYVDAQNSFGAMLRNDYVAEMIYYPAKDSWELVSLVLN